VIGGSIFEHFSFFLERLEDFHPSRKDSIGDLL